MRPLDRRGDPPLLSAAPDEVVVIGAIGLWPPLLRSWLDDAGLRVVSLSNASAVLARMLTGDVRAVLVRVHQLSICESVVLSLCRKLSPRTLVIVFGDRRPMLDVAEPASHCATTWLKWPASRTQVSVALGVNRIQQRRRRPVAGRRRERRKD